MARILLEDVSLSFRRRHRAGSSLKDWVLGRWIKGPRPPQACAVEALKGISVEVTEGQRFGIIGHNGAGKTTLLRVLAGIYRPSRGRRLVEGRISSLFEIGLGFELEATGWENIRYRGYLQRESPRSIREKMKSIADFSGLDDATMNMPVRYYSSGMLVRLAFSIATAINPEILLIDEVLGAGDLSFIQKARQRMQELLQQARLIVLVSHDMDALAKFCDRVMWLDHGQIRQIGPVKATVAAYRKFMTAPVPPQAA